MVVVFCMSDSCGSSSWRVACQSFVKTRLRAYAAARGFDGGCRVNGGIIKRFVRIIFLQLIVRWLIIDCLRIDRRFRIDGGVPDELIHPPFRRHFTGPCDRVSSFVEVEHDFSLYPDLFGVREVDSVACACRVEADEVAHACVSVKFAGIGDFDPCRCPKGN